MLQAREPRFSSDLAVRVVGLDFNGNRFKQSARVENISRHGGRLNGLYCVRAPGDLLDVEHRSKKATFRIIWIDALSGRVGICCTDDRCIWGELPSVGETVVGSTTCPARVELAENVQSPLPESHRHREPINLVSGTVDEHPPATSHPGPRPRASDKVQRRFPRYRCRGGVAANTKDMPTKLWGRLAVIGLGGCYVETITPFKTGTKLELLIGACGLETRLSGEVRYCRTREGMGIMFMDVGESQRVELERIVTLASGRRE